MDKRICVRKYTESDLKAMVDIWNEVVEDGIAFPQENCLDEDSGRKFFAEQNYCGVAEDMEDGSIKGLYILHPNNIGRCGHIGNASYAVASKSRGLHIGEELVLDSVRQAHEEGFRLIQFNAVVDSNIHAKHLYERVGFHLVGTIPKGFKMKNGEYEDICLYYIEV